MEFLKNLFKDKVIKAQLIVILFSLILGTLLHFTYEWSGNNLFVGSFSAVNESIWEHLKLVFYPMIIAMIVEYFFIKENVNNYIEAKTIGIFTVISFIASIIIIDILIFIFSIILGEYIAYKLMKRKNESTVLSTSLSIIILIFFLLCFIIFTYLPLEVNLFRDITTGTYGIGNIN